MPGPSTFSPRHNGRAAEGLQVSAGGGAVSSTARAQPSPNIPSRKLLTRIAPPSIPKPSPTKLLQRISPPSVPAAAPTRENITCHRSTRPSPKVGPFRRQAPLTFSNVSGEESSKERSRERAQAQRKMSSTASSAMQRLTVFRALPLTLPGKWRQLQQSQRGAPPALCNEPEDAINSARELAEVTDSKQGATNNTLSSQDEQGAVASQQGGEVSSLMHRLSVSRGGDVLTTPFLRTSASRCQSRRASAVSTVDKAARRPMQLDCSDNLDKNSPESSPSHNSTTPTSAQRALLAQESGSTSSNPSSPSHSEMSADFEHGFASQGPMSMETPNAPQSQRRRRPGGRAAKYALHEAAPSESGVDDGSSIATNIDQDQTQNAGCSRSASRLTSVRTSIETVPGLPANDVQRAASDQSTNSATNMWTRISSSGVWGGWTPSYVSSVVTSRRSSNRSSVGVAAPGAEALAQKPILEEGEHGSVAESAPDGIAGGSRPDSRRSSTGSWAEWRTDFPLEILDSVADFYTAMYVNASGQRFVSLEEIEQLASKVLGFPATAILREAEMRSLTSAASQAAGAPLFFTSLKSFLDLIRGAVERIQHEDSRFLWSLEDLQHIEKTFHHYANASGKMPIARLFELVEDLNFPGFNIKDVDQQSWLACVARNALGGEPEKRWFSKAPACPGATTLSVEDLLRVLSAALLEQERRERREAFKRERQAQHVAGFTLEEVEDLRELHGSFLGLEIEGNNHPLPHLLKLFGLCGIPALSNEEVVALREILQSQTVEEEQPSVQALSDISFDVFLTWMKQVFEQGIGGLQVPSRGASDSGVESEQCKGFVGAMMRERQQAATTKASAVKTNESSVRSSARDQGCQPLLHKWLSSNQPSRAGSRIPSAAGSRIGSRHGSRNKGHGARSTSRSLSRSGSRAGSRSNSITSAGNAKGDGTGAERLNAEGGKLLLMKGLPPSEAMLGRKRFRANSITGSEAASNAGERAQSQQQEQQQQVEDDQDQKKDEVPEPLEQSAQTEPCQVEPPVLPQDPPKDASLQQQQQQPEVRISLPVRPCTAPKQAKENESLRQEKQAQDSFAVVNDAISRLNALAALDARTSNSEQSDSEEE